MVLSLTANNHAVVNPESSQSILPSLTDKNNESSVCIKLSNFNNSMRKNVSETEGVHVIIEDSDWIALFPVVYV